MTERISRSEQKRQFKRIESIARELSDLSSSDLTRLPASEPLKEEITICWKTKSGAKKRQIKYIAKMLQSEPVSEILQFLQQRKGSRLEEKRRQHEAERLRDTIINDALSSYEDCRRYRKEWDLNWESSAISSIVQHYPEIDENELRRSAYQYARSRSKTHYRELFRILKAAGEKVRLQDMQEPENKNQ